MHRGQWSQATLACYARLTSIEQAAGCVDGLTAEQKARLAAAQSAAMSYSDEAALAPVAFDAKAIPPDCAKLVAVIPRLDHCAKVTDATKRAYRQSFAVSTRAWATAATTAADIKAGWAIGCQMKAKYITDHCGG